jgi:hypothetical protein
MYIETLRRQTHLLTIAQAAKLLGMTPDELESVLWVRNFPMASTVGHGPTTMIDPQVLASELEVRLKKN